MSELFVFVESNTTGTGVRAIHTLLERGDEVVLLTRRPEQYPLLAGDLPGLSVVLLDTNEVESVAAEVERLARRRPIAALLTFSEFYVETVAEIAARRGLPYLSPGAARLCRDKYQTRCTLAAAGLATPRFRRVASAGEALAAAGELGYPLIVKPPADSSSQGVRRVAEDGELLDQFRRLHGRERNDRGQRLSGDVLLESLLEGPEVSVETFTLSPGDTRVVGITAKHLSPPPVFVETGHDFPAALAPGLAARIEGEVLAALAAVGFDFGPAHTEVRLTPSGPVVVEINPRLAGGMIPELVRLALGVDLLAALLAGLQGQPVDLAARRCDWASIRFLLADHAGVLSAVDGAEAARRLPRVQEVAVTKPLGAAVEPAQEAAHRLGYVIAGGPSRAEVLAAVDEAVATIRLTLDTSGAEPFTSEGRL
jgi:biotin carboxylase